MKIKLAKTLTWQLGKCLILGNHLHNPVREIQEHLKTIYFIGLLAIEITHNLKFKEINKHG